MNAKKSIPTLIAISLAVSGLGACGGGSGDSVVVRVGGTVITRATVDHRMAVIAGGRVGQDLSTRRGALRQQALSFLISSAWLIGEATERGLEVSKQEIARQITRKRDIAFPGGEQEFREFLKTTGQAAPDMALEAEAELAAAKIRALLASQERVVTQAEVADYYSRHKQSFVIPERRKIEISNRKTAKELRQLKRQVEATRNFRSRAKTESIERPVARADAELTSLERAIYSAKQNVLTGPVKHGVDYYLLLVKSITPASEPTLQQTEGAIKKQLTAERQRRTLADFIKAWRDKWRARTNCLAGYVVQKCRQYVPSGSSSPEDPYALE